MKPTPDDILPQDLARLAVESFIMYGLRVPAPSAPRGVLTEHAAAFVTIRTKDGRLRGCIGTTEPSCVSVADEVIQNAISAATRDPRFVGVDTAELPFLSYGVDVLSPPEPARGPEDLDPALFGVIIETPDGSRRGLLLPGIGGIETVHAQWHAVHEKAGIKPGTPVLVQRFTVRRFGKE